MVQFKRGKKRRDERGASLVEFALIAPLLIMLVMGIVDFGWMLGQFQDVRHGAREAARLAAVNTGDVATMGALVCNAMDISAGARVTFTDSPAVVGPPAIPEGTAGQNGTVEVTAPVQSLTGFSSLPFADTVYPTSLTSEFDFRLEQDSANWTGGFHDC